MGAATGTATGPAGGSGKLEKPLAEWRKVLPADADGVLFEEYTEPPFSTRSTMSMGAGTFICAACAPLLSSEAKFDSGTGWPSFYAALPNSVATKADNARS